MSDARPGHEAVLKRRAALARELEEEITLDALTARFTIFQRRRGHRHSTDDLLTAVYALTHAVSLEARPRRLLDLGSGIGSVGLAILDRADGTHLTAVEVQAVSHRLLLENVWANGVAERVRVVHGDLRAAVPDETFDLVTGSPPYFDPSTGIVSADSQRAAARFELHGDVRDYCRAARKAMAPSARFVFCFPQNQRARAEAACAAADLAVLTSQDVIPREGVAPLFSLFACARGDEAPDGPSILEPPHVVRDVEGAPTKAHLAARGVLGFSV